MTAPIDFKSRLYGSYCSGHVGIGSAELQTALQARAPYVQRLIKRWVPRERSTRILDVGCGYGGILYFLKQLGYTSLSGVDVSQEEVDLAHELGLSCVRQGDLRHSLQEMPAGSIDVLFAFDLLEHFNREELIEVGDLMHRVVAPGGRLIVHLPNAAAIFSGVIRYGDLTHEVAFTPRSLQQFGNACGFELHAVEEDVPVSHGLASTLRFFIWKIGTIPFRLLFLAENPGSRRHVVLSQSILAVFQRNGSAGNAA